MRSRPEVIERYAGWHESLVRRFSASQLLVQVGALTIATRSPCGPGAAPSVLGDAAHPMLPYLGQGAGQTIEDGGVCWRARSPR